MIEKARSAIILCLGDKALREVAREKTAAAMWLKLESLYMTKSLAHRLCLKQRLYSFKMTETKSIVDQLAEFNKILDDLENIEVQLEDEDKALLLLNSLPRNYEHFKDAILYGKEQDITLDEVQTSIRTKELQRQQDNKTDDNGESLNVSRGRSEKKGQSQKGKKARSKSKIGDRSKFKCFYCHKVGHFKKNCPERNRDQKSSADSADIAAISDGYESADVLVVTTSQTQKDWVMDSGCSYHMCPKKDYFETLKLKEGGTVLLGDDHPCQVQGIGTVRLKMFDNREYILKDVRYVPDLKRNLISISMFDSLGYATKTQHGVLKILNGSLVIAKGNKDKNNGLVKTLGGGSYFLTIIDDFTRRVWLYVLKDKTETYKKFRDWYTLIQNQLETKLKVLRTDNGLEFLSEQFAEFCRNQGIKRHRTVPHTPQQNGLAERMNRTILERVRCMLLGSGLSKKFWGEAATTAAYLINICKESCVLCLIFQLV
uniref:Retrovirus-related Pol polyprotein from transposon TNT 1-94 n=1 Tax=Cajanus cajan TaxID=3821 RepID=A0A151R1I8_CAJCA|nr:Retrovirus-related Pol polyprotein from transposon TNT 1-94 [Cajanus cajan]